MMDLGSPLVSHGCEGVLCCHTLKMSDDLPENEPNRKIKSIQQTMSFTDNNTEQGCNDPDCRKLFFRKKAVIYRLCFTIPMKQQTRKELFTKICTDWENKQSKQWQNDHSESEAEGVLLIRSQVHNEYGISVQDGHYDEETHWTRRKIIAKGGYCFVFLCQDLNTGALFAMKEYREKNSFSKAVNEVKIWINLDHDSICKLLGAIRVTNQVDNEVKLIMDYINGPTLQNFIQEQKRKKRLGCKQRHLALIPAMKYLRELLSALKHQEQKGICHNDLRSDNILVDRETGRLKIIDYNVSYWTDGKATGTDVADAMKVFFEMLTGEMLTGNSADMIKQEPPEIPSSLNCPRRIVNMFDKVWKDPEWRDAEILLEEVDSIIQVLEISELVGQHQRLIDVLITAKRLRCSEILEIRNADGNIVIIDEYITNYILKTVFLHLVDMFLTTTMSHGRMVLIVFEEIERYLENGRLPSFFDPSVDVLAGAEFNLETSLWVARTMTKLVRCIYERGLIRRYT